MRKLRLAFFLLLVPFLSLAGPSTAEPVPTDPSKAVAFLVPKATPPAAAKPIATGFFVSHTYPEAPGLNYSFFVTARHVVVSESGKLLDLNIRLNDATTSKARDLGLLSTKRWIFHPEAAAVDIAVHPLAPKASDHLTVPTTLFVDREGDASPGKAGGISRAAQSG